ncbi:MAG: mycothiol system anti-sigma-R factor [Actinomycetes bacterium]
MSCGEPHETDCRDVLERVYEYLDAELTHHDIAKIKHHLEECGPCLRQFDLEEALKALVRRSCRDAAPADLRLKIMARITQARVRLE